MSKSMIGKVFPRKGGRYPGNWIVIAETPGGSFCLLGVDHENNVISAANYAGHYVRAKKAIGWVDVTQLRFTDDSVEREHGSRGSPSPILQESGEEPSPPVS